MLVRWWVLATVFVAGCAQPMNHGRVGEPVDGSGNLAGADLANADDLSFTVEHPDFWLAHDLGQSSDLTLPQDLTAARDLTPPPQDFSTDLAPTCGPRINEIQTGTTSSGAEEFVEIYNPCPDPITLSGTKLVYRSAGGSNDISLVDDIGAYGATLAKGGFLVFAGTGYFTGLSNGDLKSGLAQAGGGIALRDQLGQAIDSVGWGTATNSYVRGTVAIAPKDVAPPGHSIARPAGWIDTGNNVADFPVTTKPTPGQANQIIAP